jgi:CheY-like chemotaxis protein
VFSAASELPGLTGVRALVVEDDPDLREGVSVMLEMEGAAVSSAASGNSGFSAFLQARPDIIVSDLWMPDGDGFDFIEHVRHLSPEAGGLTPAIAVSAAENMRKALMAGFHVFLAKPFDPLHLVATIGEFFELDREQAITTWTISELGPGRLLLSLVGRIDTGDMRALTKAMTIRLQAGPVEIVSDLRRLTSFSPSVASLAQRELWSRRHQIRSVCVVGGSPAARIVSAAACKVLGIAVTFADSIEDGEHRREP